MTYVPTGLLKGPDISIIAAKVAEGLQKPNTNAGTNASQYSAAKTDGETRLILVGLGAGGPQEYAKLISARSMYPSLAALLPEDSVSRQMGQARPLAELSRNEPFQKTMLQNEFKDNPNDNKYRNVYSYAKYARAAYLKSAAKAAYGKAKEEIKSAVARVYNSGRKFFRKASGQGNLEQILSTA